MGGVHILISAFSQRSPRLARGVHHGSVRLVIGARRRDGSHGLTVLDVGRVKGNPALDPGAIRRLERAAVTSRLVQTRLDFPSLKRKRCEGQLHARTCDHGRTRRWLKRSPSACGGVEPSLECRGSRGISRPCGGRSRCRIRSGFRRSCHPTGPFRLLRQSAA